MKIISDFALLDVRESRDELTDHFAPTRIGPSEPELHMPVVIRGNTYGVVGQDDGLSHRIWGSPPGQLARRTCMPFLTSTQVAYWLGISEEAVMTQVTDGGLPRPWIREGTPLFPADVILHLILQDDDATFAGGLTLRTYDGHQYFELIKPQYKINNFEQWWAVFAVDDSSGKLWWHLRPWKTSFVKVPHSMDFLAVILDCEDNDTTEIHYEHLPTLHSAHWQFFKT